MPSATVERTVGEGDLRISASHRLIAVTLEHADHLGTTIARRRRLTGDV
jgi:hypothetical protein